MRRFIDEDETPAADSRRRPRSKASDVRHGFGSPPGMELTGRTEAQQSEDQPLTFHQPLLALADLEDSPQPLLTMSTASETPTPPSISQVERPSPPDVAEQLVRSGQSSPRRDTPALGLIRPPPRRNDQPPLTTVTTTNVQSMQDRSAPSIQQVTPTITTQQGPPPVSSELPHPMATPGARSHIFVSPPLSQTLRTPSGDNYRPPRSGHSLGAYGSVDPVQMGTPRSSISTANIFRRRGFGDYSRITEGTTPVSSRSRSDIESTGNDSASDSDSSVKERLTAQVESLNDLLLSTGKSLGSLGHTSFSPDRDNDYLEQEEQDLEEIRRKLQEELLAVDYSYLEETPGKITDQSVREDDRKPSATVSFSKLPPRRQEIGMQEFSTDWSSPLRGVSSEGQFPSVSTTSVPFDETASGILASDEEQDTKLPPQENIEPVQPGVMLSRDVSPERDTIPTQGRFLSSSTSAPFDESASGILVPDEEQDTKLPPQKTIEPVQPGALLSREVPPKRDTVATQGRYLSSSSSAPFDETASGLLAPEEEQETRFSSQQPTPTVQPGSRAVPPLSDTARMQSRIPSISTAKTPFDRRVSEITEPDEEQGTASSASESTQPSQSGLSMMQTVPHIPGTQVRFPSSSTSSAPFDETASGLLISDEEQDSNLPPQQIAQAARPGYSFSPAVTVSSYATPRLPLQVVPANETPETGNTTRQALAAIAHQEESIETDTFVDPRFDDFQGQSQGGTPPAPTVFQRYGFQTRDATPSTAFHRTPYTTTPADQSSSVASMSTIDFALSADSSPDLAFPDPPTPDIASTGSVPLDTPLSDTSSSEGFFEAVSSSSTERLARLSSPEGHVAFQDTIDQAQDQLLQPLDTTDTTTQFFSPLVARRDQAPEPPDSEIVQASSPPSPRQDLLHSLERVFFDSPSRFSDSGSYDSKTPQYAENVGVSHSPIQSKVRDERKSPERQDERKFESKWLLQATDSFEEPSSQVLSPIVQDPPKTKGNEKTTTKKHGRPLPDFYDADPAVQEDTYEFDPSKMPMSYSMETDVTFESTKKGTPYSSPKHEAKPKKRRFGYCIVYFLLFGVGLGLGLGLRGVTRNPAVVITPSPSNTPSTSPSISPTMTTPSPSKAEPPLSPAPTFQGTISTPLPSLSPSTAWPSAAPSMAPSMTPSLPIISFETTYFIIVYNGWVDNIPQEEYEGDLILSMDNLSLDVLENLPANLGKIGRSSTSVVLPSTIQEFTTIACPDRDFRHRCESVTAKINLQDAEDSWMQFKLILELAISIGQLQFQLEIVNPDSPVEVIEHIGLEPTTEPSMPSPSAFPTLQPVGVNTSEPTLSAAPTVSTPTSSPTSTFSLSPTLLTSLTPTFTNSETPTERKSAPPTPTQNALFSFLVANSFDNGEALANVDSAQYQAYQWLLNNAFLAEYSETRILQRYALATFYYSTHGDNWFFKDLWLSDNDECEWYSRSARDACTSDGEYQNLELAFNNLNGALPRELGLLSGSMERLVLNGGPTSFTVGTIPTELGYLTLLTVFYIPDNQYSGTIPTEFGTWTALRQLDVSNNHLTGPIPTELGKLIDLRAVDLSVNMLSGELPTELGLLVTCQRLTIESNMFSGPIPSELGTMRRMQALRAGSNLLTSLPSELGKLTFMDTLSLYQNDLGGTIPSELSRLSRLFYLDVSNNVLTGSIPSQLGNLFDMRDQINLSYNHLTGKLPPELGNLDRLRGLQLQNNRLTGEIPSEYSGLSSVTAIRLEGNDLAGSVPTSVCSLFNETYPAFHSDCTEFDDNCPCCTTCCQDDAGCLCRYLGTPDEFLCYQQRLLAGANDHDS